VWKSARTCILSYKYEVGNIRKFLNIASWCLVLHVTNTSNIPIGKKAEARKSILKYCVNVPFIILASCSVTLEINSNHTGSRLFLKCELKQIARRLLNNHNFNTKDSRTYFESLIVDLQSSECCLHSLSFASVSPSSLLSSRKTCMHLEMSRYL
jgi:hypothetical protein